VTEKNTPEVVLRVRILSIPSSSDFDEFDLSRYRVGQIYELSLRLATLLIIDGYAEAVGARVQSEAADFGQPPRAPKKPRHS
jgi:hypothetical protein